MCVVLVSGVVCWLVVVLWGHCGGRTRTVPSAWGKNPQEHTHSDTRPPLPFRAPTAHPAHYKTQEEIVHTAETS